MRTAIRRIAWWALVLIVVVYGIFALQMGLSELLFVLGLGAEMKHRATPVIFVVHSLAGAIALFIAPLQSIRWIRRHRGVRPRLGRTYVIAVWLASIAAILDARTFDVSVAAKIIFSVTAMLWFGTTTVGMFRARARQFAEQHEWMIRSYSLALFFVSFSLWVPTLAQTPLPRGVSYPLALFLSCTLNLALAELWIRRTRYRAGVLRGVTP